MNALLEYDEQCHKHVHFYIPIFCPEEWILFLDGNCRQSVASDFASLDVMHHTNGYSARSVADGSIVYV